MTRRCFAFTSAAAVAAAPAPRYEKGICSGIFPPAMPVVDMFAAARNAGYSGVEFPLGTAIPLDLSADALGRIRDAAAKAR